MALRDLLSALIYPFWITLQDEECNEIIRLVKTDSTALSKYLDKTVYKWWPCRTDQLDFTGSTGVLIFILIKGDNRE